MRIIELRLEGEFEREEKSELEKSMEKTKKTLDFLDAARELFTALDEELMMQGKAGQYVVIKAQPDGSVALEIIVPTMKEAMKYVNHGTFIEQIGR